MIAAGLAARHGTQFADVPFAQAALEELCPLGALVTFGGRRIRLPVGGLPITTRAIRVRGWMLMPDGPFDRIHAFVNGESFFTCDPEVRADLAAAFPHIPGAERGQFNFEIPRRVARKGRVVIVGFRAGRPVGRMQFRFRNGRHRRVPTPPSHLSAYTVNTREPHFYHAAGRKAFDEVNGALVRHTPSAGIHRLLDWGCGCGRLTAHWLRQGRIPEVHACDINGEAIEWCRANLPHGRFAIVKFEPPTEYAAASFDAIAAFSVFTHLTRPAQAAWLAEMHRILKPGGVFATTVHGRSAAWFQFGPQADAMLKTGIHDGTLSPGIEAIVGDGVYRNTYQTEEFTRETFGRWFQVLEYTERGAGNNQDLIVLRKAT